MNAYTQRCIETSTKSFNIPYVTNCQKELEKLSKELTETPTK